jgi:subtilase family serine protease
MREATSTRAGRVALAALAAGLVVLPATAQAAPQGRKPVAAASPQVTRNAVDRGAQAKSAAQSLRVYLAPNGGLDALKAAVAAIAEPGSATYGKYLTPAQFRAQYQPTDATVKAVKQWLKSQDLKVAGVEPAGRYLTVTGTTAAVEAAFATTLHQYTKGDESFQAPTATASVPDSIAADVLAVSGLDTASHTMSPKAAADAPPPAGFANARPCSAFYGQVAAKYQADFKTPLPAFMGKTIPYAPCGYQPAQFRAAYEGNVDVNGAGQTVGVVDAYAAPTIEQDADTYATRHGDPAFAAGQFSQNVPAKFTNQKLCDPSGWYGEETLDVEAVHAMAPAAGVRYYGVKSCLNQDFPDTLDTVVDEDLVSIVSNSYGDLEANENPDDVAANEQAFLQGAMEGITFFFSSGDNGDEVAATGTLQPDYPASDPYVTSVGGTSTGIAQDGSLSFQTGWGTQKYSLSADGKSWTPVGFLYGAGGGYSSLFNRPSYQDKTITSGQRAYPDVAMDADPTTGMLVGETQTFPSGVAYGEYRIGGTSLASPLMAGLEALTQQSGGARLGFINPALYKAGKNRPQLFNDVTGPGPDAGNVRPDYVNSLDPSGGIVYSVRTFNQDSSLTVGPGWDDVTGFGSPSPRYIKNFSKPNG